MALANRRSRLAIERRDFDIWPKLGRAGLAGDLETGASIAGSNVRAFGHRAAHSIAHNCEVGRIDRHSINQLRRDLLDKLTTRVGDRLDELRPVQIAAIRYC